MGRNTRKGTDTATEPITDVTEPAGTEPITDVTEPAGTDTEPEPAGTDTATATATEPAGTDTATATEPEPEPAGTDTATEPAGTDTATEPDPGATFAALFAATVADANNDDPITGDVPADRIAAVVAAYRAIRAGKARSDALLAAQGKATADATADPAAPKVGVILSATALVNACMAAASAPAQPAVTPAEQRAALALALFSISTEDDVPEEVLVALAALTELDGGIDTVIAYAAAARGDAPEPADGEQLDPEPVIVVRARGARIASTGRGVRKSQRSAARGGSGKARGTEPTKVGLHVAAVLSGDGWTQDDADGANRQPIDAAAEQPNRVLSAAASEHYPNATTKGKDGRCSTGALAAMGDAAAALAGLKRVTVDGVAGWALADDTSDDA